MDQTVLQMIVTIICSVLASGGFWAYMQSIDTKNNAQAQMILGLGHDRIVYLGMKYIERGNITKDEYENLYEYLYKPYSALGGNGSAKKVMEEVNKLPIHESSH